MCIVHPLWDTHHTRNVVTNTQTEQSSHCPIKRMFVESTL